VEMRDRKKDADAQEGGDCRKTRDEVASIQKSPATHNIAADIDEM